MREWHRGYLRTDFEMYVSSSTVAWGATRLFIALPRLLSCYHDPRTRSLVTFNTMSRTPSQEMSITPVRGIMYRLSSEPALTPYV